MGPGLVTAVVRTSTEAPLTVSTGAAAAPEPESTGRSEVLLILRVRTAHRGRNLAGDLGFAFSSLTLRLFAGDGPASIAPSPSESQRAGAAATDELRAKGVVFTGRSKVKVSTGDLGWELRPSKGTETFSHFHSPPGRGVMVEKSKFHRSCWSTYSVLSSSCSHLEILL